MSDQDRPESPIDAQMVAPPAGYRALEPEGKEADKTGFYDRPWVIIVLILHLGVLGIPAYWKTNYSVQARLVMVAASIVYTIFAVTVIYWGLMQIRALF